MRTRTDDTVITAALRQLDPAPSTDLTAEERARADATFARIVATPGDGAAAAEQVRPRRRRLLVIAGLAGAAGIAVPGLLLNGSAYGSWTPKPEPLTSEAAAAAATTCRSALELPANGERIAVAERRGAWTYVLLTGAGTEAVCLMPDGLTAREATTADGFFGSYDTDAAAPPTLAPDRIQETSSMEGSTEEGWFTWAEGYVGSDVTGVTVHTSSGRDIEASVSGNRFAAWWPSRKQSSDHPAETWSYTVHLADGSTRSAS
ncbi:hypothetical protein EFK50_08950 [Nocardioides marmoriginsengisoli]|uniref:Uncharacterized protein n=1 Tax=Nocardioides marmoriginsengisoli TaxID=661483 RepID=A0A3N0CET9_9ACTN|nr:hypothetical protein [Nocardioides marmoriginsengisoli]RNL61948.1 hypothetical protein EFK50_08950 [Nocardioides marmoriginsengisoli]